MDQVGQALDLISKYGLPLVGTVVLSVALIYVAKLYNAGWEARLRAEQDRTAYVETLRAEERAARLAADVRLDSNAAAFRDATATFAAAQKLMENLVEHAEGRTPGRGSR